MGSKHEIGATNEPQNADARVEVEDDATLNQFLQGSGKKPYTPSVIGPIVDLALLNEIAKEDDASNDATEKEMVYVRAKRQKGKEKVEEQSVGPTPTKRARKLGKVYMSPFLVQYSHLIEGTDEFKEAILEYAFSDVLDEDELFYDDGFAHLSRKLIKTMGDNVYIYSDIVDAFCLILNAKNSADDKKRIFFPNAAINLLCVSDVYVDDSQEATYGIKYVKFEETIRYWLIDCNIESVKGYQLLFFPVYAHDHFYVMVINTKSKAVEILDNRPLVEGVPFSEKYHDYPEKLRHAFSMYLKQHGMKLWEKVLNYEIKLVDMPWRTLDNNVDCGIYAMRHMETYFGKRKWNCGLRADNFDALKALRMQYAYEILVDQVNKRHADFSMKAKKYFKEIRND